MHSRRNRRPRYLPEHPPRHRPARAALRQDHAALERMRILLDENAPSGLRRILAGHDVRTAPEMGWARYSNGQLLDEAEKAGFEALITGDRSCRISRISPAEISPSSFSRPMPGPSFAPSRRRCSARSRMPHRVLSALPPFTVGDDSGPRPPPEIPAAVSGLPSVSLRCDLLVAPHHLADLRSDMRPLIRIFRGMNSQ
jgi:hypothetical protein